MTPFRRAVEELPDELEHTLQSDRRSDPERLLERLADLGWTVGVAESLTGGLVVSSLVAVPGASAVVRGGIVAYATELKHSLLGVDSDAARGARRGPSACRPADGRGRPSAPRP